MAWRSLVLAAAFAFPQIGFAGSYAELNIIVIGSELNTVGDYREDFSLFRAFEAERAEVSARWAVACRSADLGDIQIEVAASGLEVWAKPDFRPGYWVAFVPVDDDLSDTEISAFLDQFQQCVPDAYLRAAFFGEPTRHPVCTWACTNDTALYLEYCAATDYDILLPEAGVNPFKQCAISDAEFDHWLDQR